VSDVFEEALKTIDDGGGSPVYLLVGEEFLVRSAAERLLQKLMPGGMADLNLVAMDGASPRDVVAELSTLPMFGGRKVVFVRDPEFLAPKKGRADALSKARDAWKAQRRKEAARRVLAIAARAGWGVDELNPSAKGNPKASDWEKELGIELADADVAFLREVAEFCRAEGISAPSGDDVHLAQWLQNGPSREQVLLIATTEFDAKHPFVKQVKDEDGAFFEFKAAARLKDLDVTAFAAEVLAPLKKKFEPKALELLKDRVGINFRLLSSELTKLAVYSEQATITAGEVELLVGRVREDEFFELTEALQKRDFDAALQFLGDSMAQGKHPLMVLGSIAGVMRSMLTNFERMQKLTGGRPPRDYRDFQARVWPALEAETKAAKGRPPHPYSAFMSMQSAGQYGRPALLQGLAACAEADLLLKLGGDELVVERLLWTLCGKAAAWASQVHVLRRELER
jgi:DNA polymerase-3 subunit delta